MLIISKGKGATKKHNAGKLTPAQRAESLWERNKGQDATEAEAMVKELKEDEYKEKYSG
jgi:hypothetical protein|tara:strand:- start:12310 stop:12486 length:177 start_codon:yes stop_codon:yes gene_type:complete